jgi:hypothetical protein
MAQEDKKVFHSFQELRQHFFPKQHSREQARKKNGTSYEGRRQRRFSRAVSEGS